MRVFAIVLTACAIGCATTQSPAPLSVSPLVPGPGESVNVQQAVLLFDSSSSVVDADAFQGQRRVYRGFVDGMPQGSYHAGSVAFGGYDRQTLPLAPFARPTLAEHATELTELGEGTPIDRVLAEVKESLAGKSERAAVVLFSDGMPTDPVGRELETGAVLEEARALAGAYRGTVCYHTVQTGNDPAGTVFLQALAGLSSCGTYRTLASVSDPASLSQFERQVFLGAAPARMAGPGDADGDGVTDDRDQCPRTPLGVRADSRGCWVVPDLQFDTNSATIRPIGRQKLDEQVLPVLRKNPELRLRIDGHTDARGSDAYNQALSERRAQSVKDYLVAAGISADRLEVRGFGESRPIAPNDTPDNLQQNRRTELTVL
jgi:OOP family OmpA-OmpF porin